MKLLQDGSALTRGEKRNHGESCEPHTAGFLRIEEDDEQLAERFLVAFVEDRGERLHGGHAHLRPHLGPYHPLEAGDRLPAGEPREGTRSGLADLRIAVSEHGDQGLASARISDQREDRHRLQLQAVVASLERMDESLDGACAQDDQTSLGRLDFVAVRTGETPDKVPYRKGGRAERHEHSLDGPR